MPPKEIQVLQPVTVTLYGDRNFAYGIKLRILSWIILMGLKRNHKNPVTGGRSWLEGDTLLVLQM